MIFATDQTVPPHRLAPEVEARGFESLWVTEKTHVPTSRRTPWPGGELPEWYKRTCDPLLALTAAAAVTTRLRVGTGILLAALRDPVILAKELATLDWLSGGRLELGVGYGWNAEELATHGVDLDDAPAILADTLALAQALWNDDEASYRGPHATVDTSWSWPKPIQRPRPPILYGGRATVALFDDIARHGDGWLPIEGFGSVLPHLDRLRATFEQHGRDPATATVTVYSSMGDPATLETYARAGIDRVVVWLPPQPHTAVMTALDEHATTLADWLPAP
jgi:probable F420-dependent oxidoreductase